MSKVYLSTGSNHKALIFKGPFVPLQRNLKINNNGHSKRPKKLNTQEEFTICWLSVKLGVWFKGNSPHKHHRNEVAEGMAWAAKSSSLEMQTAHNVWEGPDWGALHHQYFLRKSLLYRPASPSRNLPGLFLQIPLWAVQMKSKLFRDKKKWMMNFHFTNLGPVWVQITAEAIGLGDDLGQWEVSHLRRI